MFELETLAIATPIALLYPTFVNYFSNYYTKNEELEKDCPKWRYYDPNEPKPSKEELENCEKRRKDSATTKFLMLLVAGVLGIAICAYTNTFGVALGLALGAIICILLGAFTYWEYSDDGIRTIASGAALVAMIFIAGQMYDENSQLSKKIKTLRRVDTARDQ